MRSIITMKLLSPVTLTSGMIRREWWLVTPHGRKASNSGCTEVLVEGASTPNLARCPSESVMGIPGEICPDDSAARGVLYTIRCMESSASQALAYIRKRLMSGQFAAGTRLREE